MKKNCFFVIIAILLFMGNTNRTLAQPELLIVKIHPQKLEFGPDEKLEIVFSVHNPTEQKIEFLSWHTPFEGIANKFLYLLNPQGESPEYQGKMKERGQAADDDYLTVEPGATIETQFALDEAYLLETDQPYSLQFYGGSMNGLERSNICFVHKNKKGRVIFEPISIELKIGFFDPMQESLSAFFAVENLGSDTLSILPWQSPLEGFTTNYFEVKDQYGNEQTYTGLMVSRPAPTQSDYKKLQPGEVLSNSVNLTEAYTLNPKARYSIRYRGSLLHEKTPLIYPYEVYAE